MPNPIAFEEWLPDKSDRANPTAEAKGVHSLGGQYAPFPDIQQYGPEPTVDDFTKILLHMDGADGTTGFFDDAPGTSHTWTAAGNAALDTGDSKFGGASLLCDGTGDYVSTPDSADFELGSGDFTIDCWFKVNDAGGATRGIAGQADAAVSAAGSSWFLRRLTTNQINFGISNGSGFIQIYSTTQFTNALNTGWHHCAVVRASGVLMLFIDGIQEGGNISANVTVNPTAVDLVVGATQSTVQFWQGWIDEFRISNVARYSAVTYTGNDAFTKCLIHFDGPDAITTLGDYAYGTAHNFTAAGNAQIDTAQSKFGGASGLFDGTGDWWRTPDAADLELGSSSFCIEVWFNCTATFGTFETLLGKTKIGSAGANADRSYAIYRHTTDAVLGHCFGGVAGNTSVSVRGSTRFTDLINTGWHHVAFVRDAVAARCYLFVDGVQEGGAVASANCTPTNDLDGAFALGSFGEEAGNPWTGWLDEFRLSVGTTRYTPLATNGNDAFTVVLLHFNGPDTSTLFGDDCFGAGNHVWTAAGNAQIDTADSKFGGASALFDGTGDWLTTPDTGNYAQGNGDWTIDFWFKFAGADGLTIRMAGQSDATPTNAGSAWRIVRTTGNQIQLTLCFGASASNLTTTNTYSTVSNPGWHHFAAVRTGNIVRLFVDGVQDGADLAFSSTINNSSAQLGVGAAGDLTGSGMFGWLDEFRFSVGVARWTTTFTPPTAAYGGASFTPPTAAFSATAAFGVPTVAYNFGGGAEDIVLGADTFYDNDTNPHIFFGDTSRLYVLESRMAADVSNASGYSVSDEETWQFAQFGNHVMAVSAGEAPQHYEMGVEVDFENLAGSPPSGATSVARVGDFVWMGKDFTVYWSAFNDCEDWVADPTTQAGNQELDQERGEIIALVGLDYAAIFQERGIRRAIYVGGTVIWDFGQDYVEKARGAIARNAVVPWGRLIFYAADDGFYVFDGQSSTPIGYGKVDQYFTRNLNYAWRHKISCGIDYARKLVVWGIPTGSNQLVSELLIFSIQDGRWTHDVIDLEFVFDTPAEPLTVDNFNLTFSANDLDGVISPDDIDSAAFDDRRIRLAGFQTGTHLLGLFTGGPRAATLDTKEFEPLPGQRGLLTEVWPLGDYQQANVASSVGYRRALPGASVAYTNPTNMNRAGYCPQRIDGRFLRVRQQITAGAAWRRAEGVHVTATPTGKR